MADNFFNLVGQIKLSSIKIRVYCNGIKLFVYDTLNRLIEDNHMMFRAECMDALKEMCMIGFEKGCRKLLMGEIPLLKELVLHVCKVRVYNLLVNLNTGLKINRENCDKTKR